MLQIFSRNLITEPALRDWATKVNNTLVVGFDVSPRGAMAFRFPRAVTLFTSRSAAYLDTLSGITELANWTQRCSETFRFYDQK
jgi:hypothetical protein